jgi:hypothetical protein
MGLGIAEMRYVVESAYRHQDAHFPVSLIDPPYP